MGRRPAAFSASGAVMGRGATECSPGPVALVALARGTLGRHPTGGLDHHFEDRARAASPRGPLWSIDSRASVSIGNLARSGATTLDNAGRACPVWSSLPCRFGGDTH